MKRVSLVAVVLSVLMSLAAHASSSPWEQPARTLAEEIASILGPGQAHLTIRNLSTIPTDQIPAIRRLLEQDLKARGVLASGAESANSIRITLSENVRERLWVAEIVEGNETRVAMVHVEPPIERTSTTPESIVLRKERLPLMLNNLPGILPGDALLAAVDTSSGMILLRPEEIGLYASGEVFWKGEQGADMKQPRPAPRDARGLLIRSSDGKSFTAYAAGTECVGIFMPPLGAGNGPGSWTFQCHPSDDPWPIAQADPANPSTGIKAFYNAARDYFTGVVTPSLGVDLPPFYSAAMLPRPAGAALIIGGIDGKVQSVEKGALKPITGTRDWGSDFAVLRSGCGAGTQIIASGPGEAVSDSLRAYELPALEAIPASASLSMDGTVTALWTAHDGKSVFAVVRKAAGPGSADQYEVDRVTASCN